LLFSLYSHLGIATGFIDNMFTRRTEKLLPRKEAAETHRADHSPAHHDLSILTSDDSIHFF
jgi:hypothetical protein